MRQKHKRKVGARIRPTRLAQGGQPDDKFCEIRGRAVLGALSVASHIAAIIGTIVVIVDLIRHW